jgi:GT2 family glycosyltransferase
VTIVDTQKDLSISVIIPVYNGGDNFRKCLSALTTATPLPDEIIVVIDGSTDDSDLRVASSCAQVLQTPVRGGPAQARNLGAHAAQGDILFFVDADVLVQPDTIDRVVGVFGQDPDLAAVFGSYDDSPSAPNFLSQYRNLLHHHVHQTANEDATTFWAGCGAIRRDLFLAMGGFDAGYGRPAIEDIELGYRLRQADFRIRLCKTLQVKHLKRWTAISLLKADFCYRALPWTELILRDHQLVNDLNLRYASRFSVALTFGLLGAILGAWWWPGFLIVAGLAAILLLALNTSVYRFFLRQRGPWFALRTIPWHWLYYFYSGLAFGIGVIRHLLGKLWSPVRTTPS